MNEIKSIVNQLTFEDFNQERPDLLYSRQIIHEAEKEVGRPFPPEFRWYLENIGSRRIKDNYNSILLNKDGYIRWFTFKGVVNQHLALQSYQNFNRVPWGVSLPGERRFYYPFGLIETQGDASHRILTVVLDLNEDKPQSVWAVPNSDQNVELPFEVAPGFAEFLDLIGSKDDAKNVVEENNQKAHSQFLQAYLKSQVTLPSADPDAKALLNRYLSDPAGFVLDGGRFIEYLCYQGRRCSSEAEFKLAADNWKATIQQHKIHTRRLQRRNVKVGKPRFYDGSYALNQFAHNFHLISVQSLIGPGLKLRESFLLHYGQPGWTLLSRFAFSVNKVTIKGMGTFSFNSASWESTRALRLAWCPVPVRIVVEGDELALSGPAETIIRDALSNKDFGPALEAFVFKYYREKIYPEFESLEEEEREDQKENYPKMESPDDIWKNIDGEPKLVIPADRQQMIFNVNFSWNFGHELELFLNDRVVSMPGA